MIVWTVGAVCGENFINVDSVHNNIIFFAKVLLMSAHILQKSRTNSKILGARLVTCRKFQKVEHFLLPTDAYNVKKRRVIKTF